MRQNGCKFIGKVRILSVKIVGKVYLKIKSVRKVTGKVTSKVTERRHLEMQFCNDAIDERAIRLPYNGRKRKKEKREPDDSRT